MIKREHYKTRADGVNLYRTHSTEGYTIRKVGTDEVYAEAVDVESAPFVYEETGEKITEEEYGRILAEQEAAESGGDT
jgi:hypothetical protein